MWQYIDEILVERTFTYQQDPMSVSEALRDRILTAFKNFEDHRQSLEYRTDTTALINLLRNEYVELHLDRSGYDFVTAPDLSQYDGYVKFEVDPRLLDRLLQGPDEIHWADAKIGSHLGISKQPDIYKRPLYNCLESFHA